jgi:hypothetical protein
METRADYQFSLEFPQGGSNVPRLGNVCLGSMETK